MHSTNKPLVGPGPRHPVRNTILAILGIGVAGVAVWGLPKLAHRLHPHVTTVTHHVSVPIFHALASKNAVAQINTINEKYVAWIDQQIHRVVPEIAATGPHAGTITPAILNSPGVLKKWGGPKVPMSLKGLPIPKNTPTNGAIIGLNASTLAHYTAEARRYWPSITESEVHAALIRASEFVLADNSNRALGNVPFYDSLLSGGRYDYNGLHGYPPSSQFTNSASKGGMLPLRQVNYRSWVVFPAPGTSSHPTIQPSSGSITAPSGHVRYGNVMINNVTFYTIGSGMVHGKLTVGLYVAKTAQIVLGLVTSSHRSQWYVANMGSDPYGNTPTKIYWTKP